MKKSLVALAVLAASGASMAQSSVTLYGWTDVNFGSVTQESQNGSVVSGLTQTGINGGSVNGNRVGFKGTEDLGGGLKVNFTMEMGLDIDSGKTTDSGGFSRQSWVGFSGDSWGETRFGRTTTAYDDVSGASDANMDSGLAPMNSVFRSVGYTSRPNNAMYYATPNWSGFSGAVSYAFGENKANAGATNGNKAQDASSVMALQLSYASGPLALQFGYQTEKLQSTTTTSVSSVTTAPGTVSTVTTTSTLLATDSTNFTRLGGSYDFGMFVPKLVYGKMDVGTLSTTEYMIGVDVPFGATTLSASWASSQDNDAYGADSWKRSGYGLTAMYSLSKRTFLYGGYESDTSTSNNSANTKLDLKHSVYQIGLNHNF